MTLFQETLGEKKLSKTWGIKQIFYALYLFLFSKIIHLATKQAHLFSVSEILQKRISESGNGMQIFTSACKLNIGNPLFNFMWQPCTARPSSGVSLGQIDTLYIRNVAVRSFNINQTVPQSSQNAGNSIMSWEGTYQASTMLVAIAAYLDFKLALSFLNSSPCLWRNSRYPVQQQQRK